MDSSYDQTFKSAYAGLNDAQREAVDSIDGPVLVVAGPGTGKTQLLSMRVAAILRRADVNPQNILCMTFTEDAAHNMRERLAGIIGPAAYDVEIHTFHSFGATVISRHGEFFYQGIGTQPIDELASHEIFESIFKELPHDNPLSIQFEGTFLFLKGARDAIDNFKTAGLAPDEVRAIAKDNLDFVAHANLAVAKAMDGFTRIDKTSPERFGKLLELLVARDAHPPLSSPGQRSLLLAEASSHSPWRGDAADGCDPDCSNCGNPEYSNRRTATSEAIPQPGKARTSEEVQSPSSVTRGVPQFVKPLRELTIEALEAALALVEQSSKTTPLTEFKNRFLAKDSAGQWQCKDTAASKKLLALADVYEQYLLKLRQANLIDFNDMITRVVHALETFDELRLNLQEQYQYILVDEFQDTSLAQLRLIAALTDNPVFEGRPNILAVGDDDQAIYSFQGAELSNILSYHQMYQDVKVITLTENYRSRQAILDAAAFVIEQSSERLTNRLEGVTKNIVAKNETLPEPLIAHHRYGSPEQQRQAVARDIKRLMEQGAAPQDIAVIAAKHHGLRQIVPFLHAEGIPVRYDKRENILEAPVIGELIAMVKLVTALATNDQTTANVLLPQILSYEFWGLHTKQIWHLYLAHHRERGSWLQIALESKDPAIVQIAELFVTLSMRAAHTPLEHMLDYLVGNDAVAMQATEDVQLSLVAPTFTSPFKQFYFSSQTREHQPNEYLELLSHLRFLRERLREFRVSEQLLAADLVRYVDLVEGAGIQLVDTTPHREKTNAVTLHTAHSAKGLEFGTVFIVDANHDIWTSSGSPAGKVSMPANLPIERRSGSEEERRRLLFVAMTRAKHRLIITGFEAPKRGNAPLKYLAGERQPSELSLQQHEASEQSTEEIATALRTSWHDRHIIAAAQPPMRELLQPTLERYRLSATHLQHFLNVANGGPQQWLLECLLRFPKVSTPNMAFGNAVHATLESAQKALQQTGEQRPIDDLVQDFGRVLHNYRLEADAEARLLEFGGKVLRQYLAERYNTFSRDEFFEFDVGHRPVVMEGVRLTGKIDRITPLGDNTFRVTDFKTGKAMHGWEATEPSRQIRMYHYQQQLTFYRLLLEENSVLKPGALITDTAIEFVQPDEQGNIVPPLHFEPTNEDVARLRRLIQGVWRRMIALDLPDASNYEGSLKGIQQFEADLIEEG